MCDANTYLAAELVLLMSFAFADAFDLDGIKAVDFIFVFTLLRQYSPAR